MQFLNFLVSMHEYPPLINEWRLISDHIDQVKLNNFITPRGYGRSHNLVSSKSEKTVKILNKN